MRQQSSMVIIVWRCFSLTATGEPEGHSSTKTASGMFKGLLELEPIAFLVSASMVQLPQTTLNCN
jgi:hypothetical protein